MQRAQPEHRVPCIPDPEKEHMITIQHEGSLTVVGVFARFEIADFRRLEEEIEILPDADARHMACVESVAPALRSIHAHWLALRQGAQPLPVIAAQQPARGVAKPGRNEACPCGSGRKYKHCHGADN